MGQGQSVNMAKEFRAQGNEELAAHIVHEIILQVGADGFHKVEAHDGQGQQGEHLLVPCRKDLVKNLLNERDRGSGHGPHHDGKEQSRRQWDEERAQVGKELGQNLHAFPRFFPARRRALKYFANV